MYLFANRGLEMTHGKMAAQVAHAACFAYALSDASLVPLWESTGYTKIVLEARDEFHLQTIDRWLSGENPTGLEVKHKLIIDEGRTEIAPHTMTAIGCAIIDRGDGLIEQIFSDFKTYKPHKCPKPEVKRGLFSRTRS